MANTAYPNYIQNDFAAQIVEASDAVGVLIGAQKNVGVQIEGTWAATLEFEGSVDGKNFHPVSATPVGGGSSETSTTSGGIFVASVAGLTKFQVKATSYTSGAASVVMRLQA